MRTPRTARGATGLCATWVATAAHVVVAEDIVGISIDGTL